MSHGGKEELLSKVSQFIHSQREKRQLTRALAEINLYLGKIDEKENELVQLADHLKYYRNPITSDVVKEAHTHYASDMDYLSGNDMFAVNPDVHDVLTRGGEAVYDVKPYTKVETKYRELQQSFPESLSELGRVREEINREIERNTTRARLFLDRLHAIRSQYIGQSIVSELCDAFADVYTFFREGNWEQTDLGRRLVTSYDTFDAEVPGWNRAFVQKELEDASTLLDNIDGKSLDQQQRISVITDEDNQLILAGAGSGKTLTIAAKVKYLVERRGVHPKDILLLSFTRKSADEMSERIAQRLGIDVEVSTFHKLGLSILANVHSKKPAINDEMFEFIEHYMKRAVYQDKKQLQKLLEFFGIYVNIPKDIASFDSLGEYHDRVRHIELETLKGKYSHYQYVEGQAQDLKQRLRTVGGEPVKSLEEVLIANFLFLHGVNYIYEHPYEQDTRDQQHSQYKPDFYLPDYGVYIEHFGVTKDMKAPWLSEFEETKYVESMEWKRNLHQQYGTILIESFSHYNQEGILLEKLEENLLAHGVHFREVDFEEIFTAVFEQANNNYLREFSNLICTFIGLFKSCGFKLDKLHELKERNRKEVQNRFLRRRTELFFEVVEPIYQYYQDSLKQRNEIDFNDMINLATESVREGHVKLSYKYIIIDEYQDISNSRFQLVKAIKDGTGSKVMCVGDDWQSIYRFAGSDIELFTHFGNFLGKYELLRIEKTYRNSQDLIDIAGRFVMKNPSQYQKDLTSRKRFNQPVRILGYQQSIFEALDTAIREVVSTHGPDAEIMLLGRNNFDVTVLDKSPDFTQKYDRQLERHVVTYRPFAKLNLFFLTAHRSKGLEANNVIILNAANSTTGFPNQICDDPVLAYVLTGYDAFPYAEERRLFYVALTRTKNCTYILAPDSRMSTFVTELIEEQQIPYNVIGETNSPKNHPHCTRCKTGHLVVRESGKSRFLGCTNYPTCTKTIRDLSVLRDPVVCPNCSGYMVRRKGKFGPFYGCTNYPDCRQTLQNKPSM